MNLLGAIKELCARPLVLAAAGLAAGILAGHGGNVLPYAVAISLSSFLLVRTKCDKKVRDRRLAIFFLIILSFLTGIFRIRDVGMLKQNGTFPQKALKDTVITAEILDVSYSRDQYVLTLENPIIELNEESQKTLGEGARLPEGFILAYSDSVDGGRAGDRVCVKGSLYSFNKATNYGQFDQREYYLSKNICLKVYADELTVIGHNGTVADMVKSFLSDVSMAFQNGLAVSFDEKDKGILSAMLAGNRSELDEDVKGVYQRVGIAHVLSISGLHVTLIGMGLFGFLLKVSGRLKFSIVVSCLLIFLYGLLTGFSVSTTRAVIMIFCMLFARYVGEAYDGQSAAGLAAMIILVANPTQLFESGFQLSFVAVFGIFAGNEIAKNHKLKNKAVIYLLPAVSAQVATLPVILWTYYSFCPYSIIANVLLLPFMPVIVVSGFLSGIFGALYDAMGSVPIGEVARIFAGPAHFVLKGYGVVSEFVLNMPGADLITGSPGLFRCVCHYVAMFGMVFASRAFGPLKGRLRKFAYVLLIFLMPAIMLLRLPTKGFYSGFLDVGQGLSVYIEVDGKGVLFDGGSSNVKGVGDYRIEPFLLWRGVDSLEYCFVSHTDEDHISGIRELMVSGRIRIENLVLGCNYGETEPLAVLAKEKGINVIFIKAGTIIDNYVDLLLAKDGDNIYDRGSSDLWMQCLSPDPDYVYEDANQASLVVLLKYGKLSMLLTGDSDEYMEGVYTRYLYEMGGVNVLQCPHHGSKYSCSRTLLECIRPDATIISCSLTNVYGHPSGEVLERLDDIGSEVFITRDDGMVTITYDGHGPYTIEGYCD